MDDGTFYKTLKAAIDAGKNELYLYGNVGSAENPVEPVESPAGNNITINLNGHTLQGGSNGRNATITVAKDASLAVKGDTGGTLLSTGIYHHAREYVVENHGTLKLENVSVNGVTYNGKLVGLEGNTAVSIPQNALIRSDGDLTITGCDIDNKLMLALYPYGGDVVDYFDGEYDGGLGVLVYGGEAVIESGTITGDCNGVNVSGGHLDIQGRTINTNIQLK